MTRVVMMSVLVALAVSPALAQEQPNVEQLQRMNYDLMEQLKDAQKRKNELATQNAELQKQVDELTARLEENRQALDTLQNRAFFLREHYQAWQQFIDGNPTIAGLWQRFFSADFHPQAAFDLLGDGRWPFVAQG